MARKYSALRTPMQGTVAGKGTCPKIAPNTTIPGFAPKHPAAMSSAMPAKNAIKGYGKRT